MKSHSKGWADHDSKSRLRRWLEPPAPLVRNPRELIHVPLGPRNLYIGGAGVRPDGYVNVDLFAKLAGAAEKTDRGMSRFPM